MLALRVDTGAWGEWVRASVLHNVAADSELGGSEQFRQILVRLHSDATFFAIQLHREVVAVPASQRGRLPHSIPFLCLNTSLYLSKRLNNGQVGATIRVVSRLRVLARMNNVLDTTRWQRFPLFAHQATQVVDSFLVGLRELRHELKWHLVSELRVVANRNHLSGMCQWRGGVDRT